MSFGSFVVSDSLFDLLADVSHLGLVFSVHILLFFDEGYELLVFAVDRFFFAACCCSSVSATYLAVAVIVVECCGSSISVCCCRCRCRVAAVHVSQTPRVLLDHACQ